MPSVNHSWAVLKGKRTGDRQEAREFMKSMTSNQRKLRGKLEARAKSRIRSKEYYKPGHG